MKKVTSEVLSILIRGLLGILAIILINDILFRNGISSRVGVNETNAVVCSVLGVPGIALLYGISYLILIYS